MGLNRIGDSMRTPLPPHCPWAQACAGPPCIRHVPQLHTESCQNLARQLAGATSLYVTGAPFGGPCLTNRSVPVNHRLEHRC